MTQILLFLAMFTCLEPKMENQTQEAWNKGDREMMYYCKVKCRKQYKSCLSLFVKRPNNHYWAICGNNSENVLKREAMDEI